MLTRLQLREELKKELVGKTFDYCWEWAIDGVVKKIVKDNGYNEMIYTSNTGCGRRRSSGQTTYIMYRDSQGNVQELGYVDAKKERKDKKGYYGYGGKHYDWIFKDFNIYFYNQINSLTDIIDKANAEIQAKNNKEQTLKNNSNEVFTLLVEKFGEIQAREIIRYMSKNIYSLEYSKKV